jgi:hypothetical protein
MDEHECLVDEVRSLRERRYSPGEIVIHRKLSLGTQSDHGERFAERALCAAVTCRMQHRSLFTYLSELIAAHTRGDPCPALAG